MKHSWIVIKPEAGRLMLSIIKCIRSNVDGVSLETHSGVELSGPDISVLCDVPSKPIQAYVADHLCCKPLTVIRIQSEDSSLEDRIAVLRGRHFDPNACEPTTLRRVLSEETTVSPVNVIDGQQYFPNFVETPQSSEQIVLYDRILQKHFS